MDTEHNVRTVTDQAAPNGVARAVQEPRAAVVIMPPGVPSGSASGVPVPARIDAPSTQQRGPAPDGGTDAPA
jgi:hypothetical protein